MTLIWRLSLRRPRSFRPVWGILTRLALVVFLFAACAASPAAESPPASDSGSDPIAATFRQVSELMGLPVRKPVPRAKISREEVRELLERRLTEDTDPEELRLEELFLKKFGFVGPDFDLRSQLVDVVTEQAAALYDFQDQKLYLADWADSDLQEFALIHELVHALQDQHLTLKNFVDRAATADGDLARTAVLEGQASWVMTEVVFNESGRTLRGNPFIAKTAAMAARFEAGQYPVYSSAPLYIRETLLFPYAEGMLFQQTVLDELGDCGFVEILQYPPVSTQQILDPRAYLENRRPSRPEVPAPDAAGFEQTADGDVGQLEHRILLEQYIGEEEARDLSPEWRGAQFELWENASKDKAILAYSAQWSSPQAAERFFRRYVQVLQEKLSAPVFDHQGGKIVWGRSGEGAFIAAVRGRFVTSLEGLPNDRVEANRGRIRGLLETLLP